MSKLDEAVQMAETAAGSLGERKADGVEQIESAFVELFERLKDRKQTLIDDLHSQFNIKLDLIRKPGIN